MPLAITREPRSFQIVVGKALLALALAIANIISPSQLVAQEFDFEGDGRDDLSVYDSTASRFYVRASSIPTVILQNSLGTTGDVPAPGDYNGDGRADRATFNRSTGKWSILLSNGQFVSLVFGTPGELPVPARYSGYSCSDLAVFNPQTAVWTVGNCRVFGPPLFIQFGLPGDTALAGDVDGDLLDDMTVVTLQTMTWRIRGTSSGISTVQFGLPGDIPLIGNFVGDFRAELLVFRPTTNQFFARLNTGQVLAWPAPAGQFGDRLGLLDVDGDSLLDLVTHHPRSSTFDIATSTLATFSNISVVGPIAAGLQSPAPSLALPINSSVYASGAVAGDFDRDLRSEIALTRAVEGLHQWIVHTTGGSAYFYEFGHATDQILTGDPDGDLREQPIAVRNRTDGGLDWFIRSSDGSARAYFFGLHGDAPVVGDFDCDGKDDLAVVRKKGNGLVWFFNLSSSRAADFGNVPSVAWGLAGDRAFAADLNGDMCDELVVAQNFLGGIHWYYRSLLTGSSGDIPWGLAASDTPLTAMDFDGDGHDDPAIIRNQDGVQTAYLRLLGGVAQRITLGKTGIALGGNFNGLNRAEVALFHEATEIEPARLTTHRFDGVTKTIALPLSGIGDRLVLSGVVYNAQAPSSTTPPPTTSSSVQCNATKSFVDGQGGRLWKPVSEAFNSPVILMPREYWTETASIEIFSKTGVKIVSATRRACCPNGGRAHYDVRHSLAALDQQSPLTVRFNFRDGQNECYPVAQASSRYD